MASRETLQELVIGAYELRACKSHPRGLRGQFDTLSIARISSARNYLLEVMSWVRTPKHIQRLNNLIDGEQ